MREEGSRGECGCSPTGADGEKAKHIVRTREPESSPGRLEGRRVGRGQRVEKHVPANYRSATPGTEDLYSKIYSWDSRKIDGSPQNNKIMSRKLLWPVDKET